MGKLTKAQKIARAIINYLVERYFPNGLFFYGDGPLFSFRRMDEKRGVNIGGMAAITLARIAAENKAASLTVDAEGVTVNDEDLGDWRITVERLAHHDTAGEGN